jgi:radical SAM superfamily enzyme YgiQ (UPF0313 family)
LRVLFIYPNIDAQVGFNYGVASLSAVLKEKGHETGLINLNEKLAPIPPDEELLEKIREFNPDIVGFSCVTTQFKHAERIARMVKEKLGIRTIAGGVHPTMVPAEVLRTAAFDFACLGEAEEALPELLERLQNQADTTNVPNIWAAKDLSIYTNKVHAFPDITKLPRKDYSISNFQRMIDAKDGWVGLMAGRGCPFKCTYCFNHQIIERYRHDTGMSVVELNYIRHHPVEDIIAEMQYLVENYERIKMFIFDDDVFTLDKKYVLDFCEMYRSKEIGIPFVVNAHVKLFDEEMAQALSKAGCRIVKFGLESGSSRVRREILRRFMSNEAIAEAFDICRRHNLHSSAFLMIGLPTETVDELFETVNLLGKTLPGRFRWSVFYPFPGTEAYNIAKKAKAINEEKLATLPNFFTDSCLDFGEEHNLLLDKLNAVLPWYANAASSLPCAGAYSKMIERIAPLTREQWEKENESFVGLDALMSKKALSKGMRHYAIKYNRFMGVDSDYFTRDDA